MEFCTLTKQNIISRLKSIRELTDAFVKTRDVYYRNSAINILTNTLYDFEMYDITDFSSIETKLFKHGLVYMKMMITFGTDIGMFYVIMKNLALYASDSQNNKQVKLEEFADLNRLLIEL